MCGDTHARRFRTAALARGGGVRDGSMCVCVRRGHWQGAKQLPGEGDCGRGGEEGYNWYQMPSEANDLTNAVLIKQIL